MKKRPILMQGWGVRAILDDRKTHTRRVIKPQPDYSILKAGVQLEPHRCPCLGPAHYGRSEWGLYGAPHHPGDVPCFGYNCPYGKPGDLLWVRETFAVECNAGYQDVYTEPDTPLGPVFIHSEYFECPRYKASEPDTILGDEEDGMKWQPSIHMPKKHTRLWLRIIDIRVERVRDISDEDIAAEGCEPEICNSAWDMFCSLWDSINAKRGYSWESNPWVWVVVFERVEK